MSQWAYLKAEHGDGHKFTTTHSLPKLVCIFVTELSTAVPEILERPHVHLFSISFFSIYLSSVKLKQQHNDR